jgi:purine nucleosidase
MTPDILARLSGPSPVLRFIEDAMRFYFEVNRDRGLGYLAHLHDPLAAAVALNPELVVTRAATVNVDLAPPWSEARGATIADWSGGREPNARIGIDVDPTVFLDLFVDRVAAFAERFS